MARNTWDAVLASSPLNATAGAVTSNGYEYRPEAGVITEMRWDGPPAMVRHVADALHPDLTGRVVGRLTVIGKLAWKPKGDTMWVCRCVCGTYVGRRSKTIKNGKGCQCNECAHTAQLRWLSSNNRSRENAESEKARKWTTPQPNVDEGDGE